MLIAMTNFHFNANFNPAEAGAFLTRTASHEAANTYQELMLLMNLYPFFVGLALLIYFLILTYLLIGINHHHG
jgi:hypothetical protein